MFRTAAKLNIHTLTAESESDAKSLPKENPMLRSSLTVMM